MEIHLIAGAQWLDLANAERKQIAFAVACHAGLCLSQRQGLGLLARQPELARTEECLGREDGAC